MDEMFLYEVLELEVSQLVYEMARKIAQREKMIIHPVEIENVLDNPEIFIAIFKAYIQMTPHTYRRFAVFDKDGNFLIKEQRITKNQQVQDFKFTQKGDVIECYDTKEQELYRFKLPEPESGGMIM